MSDCARRRAADRMPQIPFRLSPMQTSTLPTDRPTFATPSVLYVFSAEQRRASFIIKIVGVVLSSGLLALGAAQGEIRYLPWCLGLLGVLALLDAACTSQARRYAEQHNEIARRLAANSGGKIYERDWLLIPAAQSLPQSAMGVLGALASPGVLGFHATVLLLTALPLSGALDHLRHSSFGGSKAVAAGGCCGSGGSAAGGGCGSGGCGSGSKGASAAGGGACGCGSKATAQAKPAAVAPASTAVGATTAKKGPVPAIPAVVRTNNAALAAPQQPVLKNGKVYMTMPPHTNPRQNLPLPTRPATTGAASKPSVAPVNRPASSEAVSPSGPSPFTTPPAAQPSSPAAASAPPQVDGNK
jgi:hypothetical protein